MQPVSSVCSRLPLFTEGDFHPLTHVLLPAKDAETPRFHRHAHCSAVGSSLRLFPFLWGYIYKPSAELLWFLLPSVPLVFRAFPLTFPTPVTFPSGGRALVPSARSVRRHATRRARTPTAEQESAPWNQFICKTPAARRINNGNYFQTNWNQKAQPGSLAARQQGKPQKEEISAPNISGTLLSPFRQMFFYLSCSPKLKNFLHP